MDDDPISIFPEEITSNANPVVTASDMDALVAQQMAELSLGEREKVYYDIHGVSDQVEETAELIEEKLQEFDEQLRQLETSSQAAAYRQAKSLDPTYVNDPHLRLSFLRADLFQASEAAARYIKHFQTKLDLFGPDLLCSNITQDDLPPETLDALYSGLVQYLPLRDRAGRLVHVSLYHPDEISLQAKLQRTFYMGMVSNEDEETQRKGMFLVED